ncbi:MAG: hypothetical protein ACI85V_002678, partial [bacterium]
MTAFSAAKQSRKFRFCSILCAASARSTKFEFTDWAQTCRSLRNPRMSGQG